MGRSIRSLTLSSLSTWGAGVMWQVWQLWVYSWPQYATTHSTAHKSHILWVTNQCESTMEKHWSVDISVGSLQWRHDERDGVSNHQPHDCLLNHLFRHRLMKTSKLRVTGLCEGHSPVTAKFPTQRVSNAENISIWWRHYGVSNRRYVATIISRWY